MAGAVPLTGEPTPINQGRLMMYTWQGQWTQAKDPPLRLSGGPALDLDYGLPIESRR